MGKYKLSKEGFAIVEIEKPPVSLFPPHLVRLAESGRIKKSDLQCLSLAQLLRFAYRYKNVESLLKIKGVPLVPTLKDGSRLEIYPHQIAAMEWMEKREQTRHHGVRGGIIRMNMGLGKTLTAIAFSLSHPDPDGYPTLIVASKTVMLEWKTSGIDKFLAGGVSVLYLHKDFMGTSFKEISWEAVKSYDLVITTYDVCMSVCRKRHAEELVCEMGGDHTMQKGKVVAIHSRFGAPCSGRVDVKKSYGPNVIYDMRWWRVVADESQRFANPKTYTYKAMMAIWARHAWCLTGTPIRNYDTDIWAQLRFCGYTGVDKAIDWKRRGDIVYKSHGLVQCMFSMTNVGAKVVLPPRHDHHLLVALESKEQTVYDYVKGKAKEIYDQMLQGLVSFSCMLAVITRLRQACIAPYLMTSQSKRQKGMSATAKKAEEFAMQEINNMKRDLGNSLGAWVYDKSGAAGIKSTKIQSIIQILKRVPQGEKVLIFSSFTSALDLVADALREYMPSFRFLQVDGDTTGEDRNTNLDDFRMDGECRALLMSYKVGSEGLNLTEASHVFGLEPWWTPAVLAQATARAYRNGQKKPVHVHTVIMKGTIEERVLEICSEKELLADRYLEGAEKKVSGLTKFTIGRILR